MRCPVILLAFAGAVIVAACGGSNDRSTQDAVVSDAASETVNDTTLATAVSSIPRTVEIQFELECPTTSEIEGILGMPMEQVIRSEYQYGVEYESVELESQEYYEHFVVHADSVASRFATYEGEGYSAFECLYVKSEAIVLGLTSVRDARIRDYDLSEQETGVPAPVPRPDLGDEVFMGRHATDNSTECAIFSRDYYVTLTTIGQSPNTVLQEDTCTYLEDFLDVFWV